MGIRDQGVPVLVTYPIEMGELSNQPSGWLHVLNHSPTTTSIVRTYCTNHDDEGHQQSRCGGSPDSVGDWGTADSEGLRVLQLLGPVRSIPIADR